MIILNDIVPLNFDTVITIGNFDGVHIAHRRLISETKSLAKKLRAKSLVFTFVPHTKKVLEDENFKTFFSDTEKRNAIGKLNPDYLLEYPFNKNFAKLDTESFLDLIITQLNCKAIICGQDYRFGCDNSHAIIEKYNDKIKLKIIPDIYLGKIKISSTYMRQLKYHR